MKAFLEATKINVCSWSQVPSSGTAPLLRVGRLFSLWTPFLHGTRQPCSSLMCKMGQELGPGRHSCRQGFLQHHAERFLPAQAKGSCCSCLPATSYEEESQQPSGLGWVGLTQMEGSRLLSKPSFWVLCFPSSPSVMPSFEPFRNLMIPICLFWALLPHSHQNPLVQRNKETVTAMHYWWDCKST